MPLILPARTLDSSYEIDNSLRFNDDDSPSVSNNPNTGSGSDGSRTQFSISMWVKRSRVSGTQQFLTSAVATNTFYGTIKFNGDNKIQVNLINSGSDQDEIVTDAVYRDVSAWYHLFFVFDKTQAALSNGIKLYVNGVLQTWGTTTYAQNQGYHFFRPGKTHYIGNYNGQEGYFDGHMAEIHFVDGQLKAHTDFGETNDNGVWVPKEYEGTHGTYGFHLEFKQTGTSEDSSGIGADTSGNDEHFAVANLTATDQTTDTPTNNFATLNSLSEISTSVTFSEGNTKASIGAGSTNRAVGNMGFTSGKWYYEVKYVSTSASASYLEVGFVNTDISMRYHIRGSDGERWDNGSPSSATSYRHDPSDIIGVYIDADNQKWYLQVNGSNEDAGNGTADVSAGTGFVHQNFAVTDFILPYFANASGSGGHVFEVNFGNAPFSISSANADANGIGSFEYNPTNDGVDFYALCSKNLAEYG